MVGSDFHAEAGTSDAGIGQSLSRFDYLRLAVVSAACLALVIAGWYQTARAFAGVSANLAVIAALFLLHAGLTFAGQRFLARALISATAERLSYRTAFLFSAGVAAGLWLWWLPAGWLPAGYLVARHARRLRGAWPPRASRRGLWETPSHPAPTWRAVLGYHEGCSRALPTPATKRFFDVSLALLALVLTAPLWVLVAFLIWFEDPGPILFIKHSVGRSGADFRQLKFRSMVCDAEAATGPIPAMECDGRTLAVGRLLRKTAVDELPQLINILLGEMSFVGPRPLRTVVIHGYLRQLPAFAERGQALPGIAGLSQVIGGRYLTPLQRLRFDRIYMRHMSLRLDLQILLLAALTVIWLRWERIPYRHVPRHWVGLGRRR